MNWDGPRGESKCIYICDARERDTGANTVCAREREREKESWSHAWEGVLTLTVF
jgi:hypothetical protein